MYMRQPKKHALAPLLSLQKLSHKSHSIANLFQIANSRQTIDDHLNQCLPDSFKMQFKVSSIQGNTLLLTCNSAKLMTKFRFIEDTVISKLNAYLAPTKITNIQIKIRPNFQLSQNTKTTKSDSHRHISKKNAQILLEEAEHTSDLNLKNILTNLAKHADQ